MTLAYLRDERDFRNVQIVERPNGDFAVTIARQLAFSAYQYELYDRLRHERRPARSPPWPGRRSRRSPTTATMRRNGYCAWATAPTRATGGCRPGSRRSGRTSWRCSIPTRPWLTSGRRVASTRRCCANRGTHTSQPVLAEATLADPRARVSPAVAAGVACTPRLWAICWPRCSTLHRAHPGATW